MANPKNVWRIGPKGLWRIGPKGLSSAAHGFRLSVERSSTRGYFHFRVESDRGHAVTSFCTLASGTRQSALQAMAAAEQTAETIGSRQASRRDRSVTGIPVTLRAAPIDVQAAACMWDQGRRDAKPNYQPAHVPSGTYTSTAEQRLIPASTELARPAFNSLLSATAESIVPATAKE
jgi:hypothetical protein